MNVMRTQRILALAAAFSIVIAVKVSADLSLEEGNPLKSRDNGDVSDKSQSLTEVKGSVRVEYKNSVFYAPYYDEPEFTEKKIEFDRKIYKRLQEFLNHFCKKCFKENQSLFKYSLSNPLGLIQTFSGLFYDYNKFKRSEGMPLTNSAYSKEMGKFLKGLAELESDKEISGKQAYELASKLIDGIGEMVKVSPFGLHLNWTKLTIDNESIEKEVEPIIQYLRDSGRGNVLKIFRMVAGELEK